MLWRALADLVLVLHAAFVAFVALGALGALRWPRLAWLHLPCLAWGLWIEIRHGVCPLTPLEARLRQLSGEAGHAGGFVETHLVPLVYPPGLTPELQWLLAALLVAINLPVYALWLRRRSASRTPG